MRKWIPVALISLLFARALDARAASFTTILVPGFGTSATRITPDGSTVVGSLLGSQGFGAGAFIWSARTGVTLLGNPGEANSLGAASGVSDDGSTVVGSSTVDSRSQAFVWDAEQGARPLRLPAGTAYSGTAAISSDGRTIAGSIQTEGPPRFDRGVLWSRDTDSWSPGLLSDPSPESSIFQVWDLSGDGRTVVGTLQTVLPGGGGRAEGFVWSEADGFRGFGGSTRGSTMSQALGVSRDGTTVVGSIWVDQIIPGFGTFTQPEAFAWDAVRGTRVLESLPSVTRSLARAASANGSVVVGQSGLAPVIWDSSGRIQGIDQLLRSLGIDHPGYFLDEVSGISADGSVITGSGFDSNRNRVAWVAVIPEPAAASLIAIGLGILGMGARRRR